MRLTMNAKVFTLSGTIFCAWLLISHDVALAGHLPIHGPMPLPMPLPPRPMPLPIPRPMPSPPEIPLGEPPSLTPLPRAAGPNILGYLRPDLPWTVQINEPFKLDLWLEPLERKFAGTVDVFMEQTPKMVYDPRTFTLKPGSRQTITARIVKSPSGLAEVIATAVGWSDLFVTVDAGFSAKLNTSQLPRSLESGFPRAFNFGFVDSIGKPVPLDAPVTLAVSTSNAKLRSLANQPWSEHIALEVARGATSTPVIEILPESWAPDTGMVLAEVKINGSS